MISCVGRKTEETKRDIFTRKLREQVGMKVGGEKGANMKSGARGKRILPAVAMLIIAAIGIAAFGETLRDRFFGKPPEAPAAHFGHLRLPVNGEQFAYQTMSATQRPEAPGLRRPIRAGRGDIVEFGVVRLGVEFGEPCDYVFTAHALIDGTRVKLCETSESFPVNEWRIFRAELDVGSKEAKEIEIEYSIRPKGTRARLDAAVARALGRKYCKDFAFIEPTVVPERKAEELNVILLVLDTLRADRLGSLGHSRPTSPRIDAFAGQNMMFTHAVTSSPWTLPAHFSLLTGLYPSAVLESDDGGWDSHSYAEKLMAGILKENGYYTLAIGSLPHASGFGEGFDLFKKFNYVAVAKKSVSTRKVFSGATDWLAVNRGTRFFMLLHNYECHIPYEGTAFLGETEGGDLSETREALYDGDIKNLDAFFGQFIDNLESLDLLSNTILIVLSDHGEHFYDHFGEQDRLPPVPDPTPEVSSMDHGHSLYEELVRIPIIFHIPKFAPAKKVFDNRVSLIDILPTVLDYLDIPYDGPLQGTSLIRLMKEGSRAQEPPAISEFTFSGPEQKSVILDGYKYIYTENPDERKGGVGYRNIPEHALFDIGKDPGEKHNIYDENAELAEKLSGILATTLDESQDIRALLKARQDAAGGEAAALPSDVVESLEALGYLK
jgi:arylsulfatase A-like enzyme